MDEHGLYLQSKGYTIRCLNLKDQMKSDRYNPFAYIETEEDVIKLVANIFEAVTPEGQTANDPFWTDGPKRFAWDFYDEFVHRMNSHARLGE